MIVELYLIDWLFGGTLCVKFRRVLVDQQAGELTRTYKTFFPGRRTDLEFFYTHLIGHLIDMEKTPFSYAINN